MQWLGLRARWMTNKVGVPLTKLLFAFYLKKKMIHQKSLFNNEDDLNNHHIDNHPILCHIGYNFFKDIDLRDKHYAVRHFGISRWRVLYRSIWLEGSTETVIIIIIVCILLLHPNLNVLLPLLLLKWNWQIGHMFIVHGTKWQGHMFNGLGTTKHSVCDF